MVPLLQPDERVAEPRLFRHLLALNASAIHGAAFALVDRRVRITAERTNRDLDRSEVWTWRPA